MIAKVECKYPEIFVDLGDTNGDIFAIMAAIRSAMRAAKVPASDISAFFDEAMGLGLVALLEVCCKWVTLAPMAEDTAQSQAA